MVEWRQIENIVNIDEINSFRLSYLPKTENRWLFNVFWGHANKTFS